VKIINKITMFYFLILFVLMFFFNLLNNVSAEVKTLDGIWFICEYSISNNPPHDNCEMLDNDGFLVDQGVISHLQIKNSTQQGCRGNRTGHCFTSGTLGLKAKKRKIGKFIIGSNWVEVDYFSCTQRYWFEEFGNFWHGWPDANRCFWTREKEFFVQRYFEELTIQ